MSYYFETGDCTILKRHFFLLLFSILKFIFLLTLAGVLYYVSDTYLVGDAHMVSSWLAYVLFVLIMVVLNYAFLRLVLSIIDYYHTIIIVKGEQIFIIHCTIIMQDDMEVIDSYRITKVDVFSHGIIANLIGYGNRVIEQQRDDVRTLHFIPDPYRILKILKEQKHLSLW